MMRNHFSLLLLASLVMLASCSSAQKRNSVSISTASSGLVKNHDLTFPLYLTDKIESRSEVAAKISDNVFIVHTGHILKANATKEQNEATLQSLLGKGVDVVNLTIEDFIIADSQDISFDKYPQQFLNSSVVDLNEDNFIKKANINPYIIHEGVALIGLSDKKIDKKFSMDKFLVSDYVLAVLRARKSALKDASVDANPASPLRSFVIVHTIGADINEVMERLPPNFINSLAD
ncbi:hypothetical protein SHI21_03150 [Bacteriovorax sp. PP10]|uniref:Uncharacterized protein n=1 Tax=Bacteriovorax antarcticus TaxID=3088717 RepID=A0ABU5VQ55_9BACT|nr:hypothetical protein [Bacteriovorax sp. PP10]MEA9355177.1 hypothetical protein [Bacteriovorax sp. PP10]